ncbi:MAG: bifunctional phosphoribosyl-AMP cyclohydrolase/phosphoribosyl-ATP diphosphatase HisIE [Nannocystaceae bacterium]
MGSETMTMTMTTSESAEEGLAIDRLWAELKPDAQGLVTAVVQDAERGQVLMVGMMSREALARTIARRRVTFWSRSRRCLWEKGESSGNTLDLVDLWVDCDGDALVARARPRGPTCHTGQVSCFYRRVPEDAASAAAGALVEVAAGPPPPGDRLDRLTAVIEARKAGRGATQREGKSYVRHLLDRGPEKIAAKITEEAGELAEAICAEGDDLDLEHVAAEAADLLFHAMVGLSARGLSLDDVRRVLDARMGLSGLDEKARRGQSEA